MHNLLSVTLQLPVAVQALTWMHSPWSRPGGGGGGKKIPGNGIQFFLRSQPPEGGGGTQIFSLHI